MNEADKHKLVEAALAELLEWEELKRSPQLGSFLCYIVEHELAGQTDGIKAYAIAVDVFARTPEFDPQKDPIVRVQAARLRSLLDRFYTENLNRVPLRILVPLGRYVPKYLLLDAEKIAPDDVSSISGSDTVAKRAEQKKNLRKSIVSPAKWIVACLAFAAFGIGLLWLTQSLIWQADRQLLVEQLELERPVVRVFGFDDLSGAAGIARAIGGLAPQLSADLSRFEDLRVERSSAALPFSSGNQEYSDNVFILSGSARRENGQISFDVLLTREHSPEIVWTHSLVFPADNADYAQMMSDVARSLSAILGNHRGPLHAKNLQKTSLKLAQLSVPTIYACQLMDTLARDQVSAEHSYAARDCFAKLRDANPNSALALAGWAGNAADVLRLDADLGDDLSGALYDATQAARMAVSIAPQSSFAYGQLARVMSAQHALEQSNIAHLQAIRRNPTDLDSIAEYAQFLAFTGKLEHGVEVISLVVQQPVSAPSWYQIVPALQGLNRADYEAALESALIVSQGNPELGVVLALSAAPLAARGDVVTRFSDAALHNKNFQKLGILPWISKTIVDEDVLRMIEPGLLLAGLSDDVIWHPFTPKELDTQN